MAVILGENGVMVVVVLLVGADVGPDTAEEESTGRGSI